MITKSHKLSDLRDGDKAIVIKVHGSGAFKKRITEMGFIKGKQLTVIKKAPLQDPIEYSIMGYNVGLRHEESKMIEVKLIQSSDEVDTGKNHFDGVLDWNRSKQSVHEKSKTIHLALVGNPNCGKTTLYNHASGSHERVGNYSGVTVDAREGFIRKFGYRFKIVDLPGTYSITDYTPEELYVRNHIIEETPDIVINVVDASNIERNLYLTTQLIDMNVKVIIALNMYDEMQKSGATLDHEALGKMLGIPIIPIIAKNGTGIDTLLQKTIDVYEDRDPIVRYISINYGTIVEKSINAIQPYIKENSSVYPQFSSRYLSIKLLEKDTEVLAKISAECSNGKQIREGVEEEIKKIETEYKETSDTVITNLKYGFIDGALSETYREGLRENRKKSNSIDNILTSKILGFPIFIFFMWLMFQATFTLGQIPMDWIDLWVSKLGDFVSARMPDGIFKDLLVDGIIGGVGGVIIFLPNILILFLFISFMEDTGYMARASFLMDKIMHKMGLHGKSFIPMLMGFGCNIPAIMATRTLESRKDRVMTILAIPFMSCSARLPVYVLLISAFFTKNQGLVLISIYFFGVFVAVLTALMSKKLIFKGQDMPFVIELPPYRMPTAKSTLIHMWNKASQYLRKMGSVILMASILIWALGYFPRNIEHAVDFEEKIAQVRANPSWDNDTKQEKITLIEHQQSAEHQKKSYIGQIGHFVEPVIRPLGYDWKIGVSILTGIAAKEIVVSTMGVLYQSSDTDDATANLEKKLQEQTYTSGSKKGEKVFTPLVAYGFMVFVLLYFPCVAAIVAVRKEAGIRWALFVAIYTTLVAWVAAFLVYQVGRFFI